MCNDELEMDRAQGRSGDILEDKATKAEAPSTHRPIHEGIVVVRRMCRMPQGGIARPALRHDTYHSNRVGQMESPQDVGGGPIYGCRGIPGQWNV